MMIAFARKVGWIAVAVASLGLFCIQKVYYKASAVTLTIQPASVTVGVQTETTTPYPTLTPAEVVMECRLDRIAERVSYLYLKRKRTQDNNFITFAEMYPGENAPSLSNNAPQDIKSKAVTLTGSTANSDARIRATFHQYQMTCLDDAIYQCTINYKPQGGESHEEHSNSSLSVTVLSGQFTISVSRGSGLGGGFPQAVQNMSAVDRYTDLELYCTGGIGKSQSTQIQWYWRQGRNPVFTPYPNFGDIIQETPTPPTSTQCSYTRRSQLRYRMSDSDSQGVVFRCEVSIPSNSGTFKAYSPEFHINPGYGYDTSGGILRKTNIQFLFSCFGAWLFQHYHRLS